MKKTKIFITFLLLIILFDCKSQNSIEGHIIDGNTGRDILFANVYIKDKKNGVISDQNGFFKLDIKKENYIDTLVISVLGYEVKNIAIKSFLESKSKKTILLFENEIILPEVSIISYEIKRTKIIGNYAIEQPEGRYYMRAGSHIAVHIPNNKNEKLYLKNALFYIKNEGHPNTKFRVHVYDVCDSFGMPGNDILPVNKIVSAIKGEAWLEVDLTVYNIKIPEKGVFVAMEWLPDSQEFPYEVFFSNEEKASINHGQILGGIINNKSIFGRKNESNAWNKSFLGAWYQSPVSPESRTILNPAICVEVNVVK
ncbi:MAG: carboxypeptidase-like regulatory domain-containing protein [Bacteroidales bacterium]|nr:carboxypeptidase-like regulatory domain-containing protein [Bacteroidales bacterium]